MFRQRLVRESAYLVLILCLIALLLPSCAPSMQQAAPAEQKAARQEKKAIVLVRLAATLDYKEAHPLAEDRSLVPVQFGFANLDTAEPVRTVVPSSPSPDAAKAGWAAFMLEPGTYYFRIGVGTGRWWVMSPAEFWFVVPSDSPVLYIGSVCIECARRYFRTPLGWRREVMSCSSETPVTNETDAAAKFAGTSYSDLGPLTTAVIQPYGDPLPIKTISGLGPVGLSRLDPKTELGSPDWIRHGMETGLSSVVFFLYVRVPAAAILWAPVGTVLGYLGGKWSEASWEPCRQALEKSMLNFDPSRAIETKLNAALRQWGIETATIDRSDSHLRGSELGVKSMVLLQLQRVALRACTREFTTFCLEVATRVQLLDVAANAHLYDRVFVHSNGSPEVEYWSGEAVRPYEILLTENEWSFSPLYGPKLEEFCGDGGNETLQGELSTALDAIVYKVVQDFGLRIE